MNSEDNRQDIDHLDAFQRATLAANGQETSPAPKYVQQQKPVRLNNDDWEQQQREQSVQL